MPLNIVPTEAEMFDSLGEWNKYVQRIEETPNGLSYQVWLHPILIESSHVQYITISVYDIHVMGWSGVKASIIQTIENYIVAYVLKTGSMGLLPPTPGQIIKPNIAKPTINIPSVKQYGGYDTTKLKMVQTYLANIYSGDPTDLEKEWYVGTAHNCVGCMSSNSVPNKDHLISKFHAVNRLGVGRNELPELFRASFNYTQDQLFESAPEWPEAPEDPMADLIEERPTPVEGYRGYYLELNMGGSWLMGATKFVWESNKLQGLCHPTDYRTIEESRAKCIEHIVLGTHTATRPHINEAQQEQYRILGQAYNARSDFNTSWIRPQQTDVTQANPNYRNFNNGVTCRCGIYGFNTIDKMMDDDESFGIIAKAVAYGTVLVDNKDNFRASDAIITELWIRKEAIIQRMGLPVHITSMFLNWPMILQDLANTYQCPVTMVDKSSNDREDIKEIDRMIELDTIGAGFLNEPYRYWPEIKED